MRQLVRPAVLDVPMQRPMAGQAAVTLTGWAERGHCRNIGVIDLDLFLRTDAHSIRRAKQLCAACPVAAECRAHAHHVPERTGVWGGESERDRAAAIAGRGPRPS